MLLTDYNVLFTGDKTQRRFLKVVGEIIIGINNITTSPHLQMVDFISKYIKTYDCIFHNMVTPAVDSRKSHS